MKEYGVSHLNPFAKEKLGIQTDAVKVWVPESAGVPEGLGGWSAGGEQSPATTSSWNLYGGSSIAGEEQTSGVKAFSISTPRGRPVPPQAPRMAQFGSGFLQTSRGWEYVPPSSNAGAGAATPATAPAAFEGKTHHLEPDGKGGFWGVWRTDPLKMPLREEPPLGSV